MNILLFIGGFALLALAIFLLHMEINVWSARRHWRQAGLSVCASYRRRGEYCPHCPNRPKQDGKSGASVV